MNRWILFCAWLVACPSWGDHPNRGGVSLQVLIEEALSRSPMIQSSELEWKSAQTNYRAKFGDLGPEISLEGGPLGTRFDGDPQYGNAAYGLLEWNLYRGGRDFAELKEARQKLKVSSQKKSQTRAQVIREVTKKYLEMAFVLETMAIQKSALELNNSQAKMAEAKRSAGFTSKVDVLEFSLRKSELEASLEKLEVDRKNLSRELSWLIGRPEASADILVDGHIEKVSRKPKKDKILAALEQENVEIQIAQSEKQSAVTQKWIARSEHLPQLNLEAKYGKLADEEQVFEERDNYSVGLKVKIPLFSNLSGMNTWARTASDERQADLKMENTKRAILNQAESLFAELESVDQRQKIEERAAVQAEEYYNLTLAEYKRGVKNSPDVVGATERFLGARVRNLELRLEYQRKLLDVLALVGSEPTETRWF